MAEYEFKLTGGKAVLIALGLLGLLLFRLATLNESIEDAELRNSIEVQLQSEHYPGQVEALKRALASGGVENTRQVVDSLVAAGISIHSIKGSYPVFKFTSPRDVVVKVSYSAVTESGRSEPRVKYYLYTQGVGSHWRYHRESSVVSYYLNFF